MDLTSSRSPRATFTSLQGQYLAFIYAYTVVHRQPPAQADLQRHFGVSAPTVHSNLNTLERQGFIRRTPRRARSIEMLVDPEELPVLRNWELKRSIKIPVQRY